MLIRLVSHHKNNPKHIDKMIAIKGLPEDFLFRRGPDGIELASLGPSLKAEIEKNVPYDIRHLCEDVYVNFRYPPIEKGREWVIDHRKIVGVIIDYGMEPGRDLWERIERFVEGTVPRTERVPEPVLLAKDVHSPFETYATKKSSTGSLQLEPAPIPLIDLTLYLTPVVPKEPVRPAASAPTQESQEPPKAQLDALKCPECDYRHAKPQGIRMHRVKRHPAKEKVGT